MRLIAIVLGLFCIFASIGCEKNSPSHQAKPIVLVSSPPYAYLTALVAKGTVQVECLTPPGTNPHLFELPPKQIQKILQSSLWLRLGEPMEKKFEDIFSAKNRGLKMVDLSDGIDLLDLPHEHNCACGHEGVDRHFWMSPTLVKRQLVKISDALTSMLPANAAFYQKNLAEGIEQLNLLDQEIR